MDFILSKTTLEPTLGLLPCSFFRYYKLQMFLIPLFSAPCLSEIYWSGLKDDAPETAPPELSLCSAEHSRHVWGGAALPDRDLGVTLAQMHQHRTRMMSFLLEIYGFNQGLLFNYGVHLYIRLLAETV